MNFNWDNYSCTQWVYNVQEPCNVENSSV